MTPTRTAQSATDAASGSAAAITGIGVLVMALFPFAIPILLLTAAFTAPLLVLGVVAAVPLAIAVGAVLAMRGIGRRLAAGMTPRHEQAAFEGDRLS